MGEGRQSKRSSDGGTRTQTGSGTAGAQGPALAPGLYLVATPIGNARDITLRALDVLSGADVIAAEDTRTTQKLMSLHGISAAGRPMIAYNDVNGATRRPALMRHLREGRSVACVSDAGTPLVSDPGFRLVGEALEEGIPVVPVPGASALLAGLSVAGLPTDRFMFAGFLPVKSGPRKAALAELARVPATLVFFEAPRRLAATFADVAEVLGGDRTAAVARELTKLHEETRRGSVAELAAHYAAIEPPKGEAVLLIGPPTGGESEVDLDTALAAALETLSVKDAAATVSKATGLPRREVYARALELSGGR